MSGLRHHADPTGHALYAAVLADPFDTLRRLVYADWLEENAVDATCTACGGEGETDVGRGRVRACPSCSGGVVRDHRRERAEYIRLECERPATVDGLTRAGLLFLAHGREWLKPGPLSTVTVFDGPPSWSATPSKLEAFAERGFVGRVRCRLAWWVGGECPHCTAGTLPRYMPDDFTELDFGRDTCHSCHGTGRTPAHGPEVVARHPVTQVTVTNREPMPDAAGGWSWWDDTRVAAGDTHPESNVPHDVFTRMTGGTTIDGVAWQHPTREVAEVALSRALVDPAREAAGLPPITWEVA